MSLAAMPGDESDNKKKLEHCVTRIDETHSALQHSLPIKVSLAYTTSLLEDVDIGGLCPK